MQLCFFYLIEIILGKHFFTFVFTIPFLRLDKKIYHHTAITMITNQINIKQNILKYRISSIKCIILNFLSHYSIIMITNQNEYHQNSISQCILFIRALFKKTPISSKTFLQIGFPILVKSGPIRATSPKDFHHTTNLIRHRGTSSRNYIKQNKKKI